MDGAAPRDFSIRNGGAILWASPTRFWLCEAGYDLWVEIDATLGLTGKTFATHDPQGFACQRHPPDIPARPNIQVRYLHKQSTEVRLAAGM